MIDYSMLGLLPDMHPNMLVVKARPADRGGALAATLAAALPLTTAVTPSGGLAHLAQLDRQGAVRGVFPVGGPTDGRQGMAARGAGALTVLANQGYDADAATASLVQLTRDVDLDELVGELGADPEVEFASHVPARYAIASAPGLASAPPTGTPWNLTRIGLPDVEATGVDLGASRTVAVLDTGVDDTHPSLTRAIARYERGDTGAGLVSSTDVVGHGTHVAGTIHSTADGVVGSRGVCRARLEVYKIFDDEPDHLPRASMFAYLVHPVLYRRALADCAERAPDVVNLSIGGPAEPDPQEYALFRQLEAQGVVVVAAMGNERALGNPVFYPAAIPGVVAVAATSVNDVVAPFSNSGEHVALAAPGVGIWAPLPTYPGHVAMRATRDARGRPVPGVQFPRDVQYAAMDGTSMATPQISAAAALVQANSPRRRAPQEVRDLLMATAIRVPALNGGRWNRDIGTGVLDLRRLLFAAQRLP